MNHPPKDHTWYYVASLFTTIIYSVCALKIAFASSYVVQDDARQHIFWMHRFTNPKLFPTDNIADYFQAVDPSGYSGLYWLFNELGIEPIICHKILPFFLALITAHYCYRVCLELFPIPITGFFSVLLLNQNLWMGDNLLSGTPRAFFYPLFLAFLYYFLKQSAILCAVIILLQIFFYPHTALISLGVWLANTIYCYFDHSSKPLNPLFRQSKSQFIAITILLIGIAILFSYPEKMAAFLPVTTANMARQLPEFGLEGRSAFFQHDALSFWLLGTRSALLPIEWPYILVISFGAFLPLLYCWPQSFPLVHQIKPNIYLLWQIFSVSLLLFALSHLVLFHLHLPSRYTHHTIRVILAFADAIFITVVLDALIKKCAQKLRTLSASIWLLVKNIIIVLTLSLLILPSFAVFPYSYRLGYVQGKAKGLYRFFEQQPIDIRIASLSEQSDFIPIFAKRSVLTGREYSIPYHWGYYQPLRQKIIETIQAQYSDDLAVIQKFIQRYRIDFWLLDRAAFTQTYLLNNSWLWQFQPVSKNAANNLDKKLILAQFISDCQVYDDANFIVLESRCLLDQALE